MKNRWLIAASAVGIHLCIGSVYAWSVFNLPLENAFGWAKSDIAIRQSIQAPGTHTSIVGCFSGRGCCAPSLVPPTEPEKPRRNPLRGFSLHHAVLVRRI